MRMRCCRLQGGSVTVLAACCFAVGISAEGNGVQCSIAIMVVPGGWWRPFRASLVLMGAAMAAPGDDYLHCKTITQRTIA